MPSPFTKPRPYSEISNDVMQYLQYQEEKQARVNQTSMMFMEKYSQLPSRAIDNEGKMKRIQDYTMKVINNFKKYGNNFNKAFPEFMMTLNEASGDPFFQKMVKAKQMEDVYDQQHYENIQKHGASYIPTDMSYKTTPIQNQDGSYNDLRYDSFVMTDKSKMAEEIVKNIKPSEIDMYVDQYGKPVDINQAALTGSPAAYTHRKIKKIDEDEFGRLITDRYVLQSLDEDNPTLKKEYDYFKIGERTGMTYDQWKASTLYSYGKKYLIPTETSSTLIQNPYALEMFKHSLANNKNQGNILQRTFIPGTTQGEQPKPYDYIQSKIKDADDIIKYQSGRTRRSENEEMLLKSAEGSKRKWSGVNDEIVQRTVELANKQYPNRFSTIRTDDGRLMIKSNVEGKQTVPVELSDVISGKVLDDYKIKTYAEQASQEIVNMKGQRLNQEMSLIHKGELIDNNGLFTFKDDKQSEFWFDYTLANDIEASPHSFTMLNPATFKEDKEAIKNLSSFSNKTRMLKEGYKVIPETFGYDQDSGKWFARATVYEKDGEKWATTDERITYDITQTAEQFIPEEKKQNIRFKTNVGNQVYIPTLKGTTTRHITAEEFPEFKELLGDKDYTIMLSKDPNTPDAPIIKYSMPNDPAGSDLREWGQRGDIDGVLDMFFQHAMGEKRLESEGMVGTPIDTYGYEKLGNVFPKIKDTGSDENYMIRFLEAREGGFLDKPKADSGGWATGLGSWSTNNPGDLTLSEIYDRDIESLKRHRFSEIASMNITRDQKAAAFSWIWNTGRAGEMIEALKNYVASGNRDASRVMELLNQSKSSRTGNIDLSSRREIEKMYFKRG